MVSKLVMHTLFWAYERHSLKTTSPEILRTVGNVNGWSFDTCRWLSVYVLSDAGARVWVTRNMHVTVVTTSKQIAGMCFTHSRGHMNIR